MRCPECGGYTFDSDGRCNFCGRSTSSRPIPPSWQVTSPQSSDSAFEGLKKCPSCKLLALRWYSYESSYRCLNCRKRFTESEYTECLRKNEEPEKNNQRCNVGIEDRDWYRNPKGKHPPTCICADCTQSRLGKDYASVWAQGPAWATITSSARGCGAIRG